MSLLSSCYCHPRISTLKVDLITPASHHFPWPAAEQRFIYALGGTNNEFFGQRVAYIGREFESRWSFIVGSKAFLTPKVERTSCYRKGFTICASWFTGTQIASNAFTLGTVAVLPFYFLMVVAPKSELTKRTMESNIPYVVLGVAYTYLLFLSWTPDTLRMMFASKYLLPELPGIAKMFSSEMTLASAWIHLLAVDLFAARQVFHDGLKNEIETRHSVSLCLLFCPIGILTHVITKVLTKSVGDCE